MSDPWAGLDQEQLRGILSDGPRPLFATVSGAHLYGFPSANSDVDLRGAFVLPLESVLGLKAPEETISVERDEGGLELDWVAHDVKKLVGLMLRRNGYVLEQLYSPLVVHGGPWLDELRDLGRGCFVTHLVHHYRGFFNSQRKLLAKPEPTVKQLLYAYRVALTGVHALLRGEIECDLERLAGEHGVGGVDELLARKREGAEKGLLDAPTLEHHNTVLDGLEARLSEAHEQSSLPEHYTNGDALSDYVIRARLELGRDG